MRRLRPLDRTVPAGRLLQGVSSTFFYGGAVHHDQYVGHFDPRDPVNTDVQLFRPKVVRPLDRELVLRTLASFDPDAH